MDLYSIFIILASVILIALILFISNKTYKKEDEVTDYNVFIDGEVVKILNKPENGEIHIFHGGCYGCKRQFVEGISGCKNCCFFEANWKLPDLNTQHRINRDIKSTLKQRL